MSIKIGKYYFDGPYTSTDSLENRSGVYVVLCENNSNYGPVDCGESATVKSRIENHERKNCWNRNCSSSFKGRGSLYSELAVLRTSCHRAGNPWNVQFSMRETLRREMYTEKC